MLSNNYHHSDNHIGGGVNSTATATLPSPPTHQHFITMTGDQLKYCGAIMRNLKRHRDAGSFLKPVDHVKLNVPDYPIVIKHPMDLTRVETKLNNSDYASVEEFVADVRLVFNNCYKYNGPEAMISVLCQNVESAFEKSLRQMPPSSNCVKHHEQQLDIVSKEPSPPLSQHNSSSPPPLSSTRGFSSATQQSYEDYLLTAPRPKREIHCPSKDYPETFTTPNKRPPQNTSAQMKYCWTIIREFKKTKYRNQIFPFLKPVDPIALGIPDYTTIVKQPMDLSTIEDKLSKEEYKSPEEFEADVMLMFNNCYLYNPKTLPIYQMAQEMEKVFKEKWAQQPVFNQEEMIREKSTSSSSSSRKGSTSSNKVDQTRKRKSVEFKLDKEQDADDQLDQLQRTLQNITKQIQSMQQQPTNKKKKTLQDDTDQEEEEAPPKRKKLGRPVGRTDSVKRKRMTKKPVLYDSDDEVTDHPFTHEEKMALSKEINGLDSDRLIHVGHIIQASMPHLQKNGEEEVEIELDIDALDIHTLNEIYSYIHPYSRLSRRKQQITKRFKKSRIHYSEKQAEQQIDHLQKKLNEFEEFEKNHQLGSSHSNSCSPTTTTTGQQLPSQQEEYSESASESGDSSSGDSSGSSSESESE